MIRHFPSIDAAQRVAQHSLARLGWEIRVADVNLAAETVRLTLASTCGRLVTLDARGGKASVTREQTERYTASTGRRGDKAIVERVRTRLLGRTKFDCGARTAMRMFANYLADNSPVAQVEAADARNAVRLLMGGAA